ncbi:hypothetical protein [Luteibacter rhizovicinus]|uniref:hypothetical protein n=1 Tax=Luteibacter rhizovicinus TaxID=242606 RepID=UPI000B1EC14C|nr:hypothetical protein [Luteibacter rhizovicinus]
MTCDNTTLIPSGGNVFADLGFAEPEAGIYKTRSEAMIANEKMLAEIQASDAS